jgi:hypothetical protein
VDRIINHGCEQQLNPLLHLKESTKSKTQTAQKEFDEDKRKFTIISYSRALHHLLHKGPPRSLQEINGKSEHFVHPFIQTIFKNHKK